MIPASTHINLPSHADQLWGPFSLVCNEHEVCHLFQSSIKIVKRHCLFYSWKICGVHVIFTFVTHSGWSHISIGAAPYKYEWLANYAWPYLKHQKVWIVFLHVLYIHVCACTRVVNKDKINYVTCVKHANRTQFE